MSESNSTIDLGFEARLAHVVGTAQKWDRGVHPDELVKAIRELREYFYQRTADDAPVNER